MSTSDNNTTSVSQPVVDLDLLNSNDKSALSIFDGTTTAAPAAQRASLVSSIYSLFRRPVANSTSTTGSQPEAKALPTLSDKHVITLDESDDGFSHVDVRHLSYAEVATMSKALYPEPTDKPSKTVHVPANTVYESEQEDDDETANDLESEYGTSSVFSSASARLAHAPIEVQGAYLDGERAEDMLKKHLHHSACKVDWRTGEKKNVLWSAA